MLDADVWSANLGRVDLDPGEGEVTLPVELEFLDLQALCWPIQLPLRCPADQRWVVHEIETAADQHNGNGDWCRNGNRPGDQ